MQLIEQVHRVAKVLRLLVWSLISGLLEWLVPQAWYAKDVSDDIVLVTGAGSGLGRGIALEYAKLNASLVLWDINETGLRETKGMIEAEHKLIKEKQTKDRKTSDRFCLTYIVDVSNKETVKTMAEKVHTDLNRNRAEYEDERYVSVLINNAGIYYGLMLQDLKDEQIQRIFNINILSHFWTVRAFLPKMIEHEKGHIVEIASMGGIAGFLKQVDYCSTKFATVGFEESLSSELNYMGLGDKIRTTAICPFFFSSNLFSGFDSRAASIMTSDHVAKQAVMSMRCNHNRCMLPTFDAYLSHIIHSLLPRQTFELLTRMKGLDLGIKDIKGHAAA